MAFYALQWSWKDPQLKAMTEHPQDRTEAARRVVQAFGGRLHQYFFTVGEYDGLAIAEYPDLEHAGAASIALAASGGFARFHTTPLLTAQEAQAAMRLAHSTRSGYTLPGA